MLRKIILIAFSFSSGALLFLMLCLGAQNLNRRHVIDLGFGKTAPLPSGFLVGISIVLGVVSGGSATAAFLPDKNN